LTAESQIFVPAEVRKLLGVAAGWMLEWVLEWVLENGRVIVRRSTRVSFREIHDAINPSPRRHHARPVQPGGVHVAHPCAPPFGRPAVALVPRQRVNLTRYLVGFAPGSPMRCGIVPTPANACR
jgi:bifunctional DNA-binding transcriptional regulator/antitoxin component of YhaV-PrlF toxin-antitoxin module